MSDCSFSMCPLGQECRQLQRRSRSLAEMGPTGCAETHPISLSFIVCGLGRRRGQLYFRTKCQGLPRISSGRREPSIGFLAKNLRGTSPVRWGQPASSYDCAMPTPVALSEGGGRWNPTPKPLPPKLHGMQPPCYVQGM